MDLVLSRKAVPGKCGWASKNYFSSAYSSSVKYFGIQFSKLDASIKLNIV